MLVVDRIVRAAATCIDDYEETRKSYSKNAPKMSMYTLIDLIKKLKSQGYFLVAISISRRSTVEPFATKYGFDAWVRQQWELAGDEFFTGNITKTHTSKDIILKDIVKRHNLTLKDSVAVGDSNGDVGMLQTVEHPIAFNPTAELYEKAVAAGWTIAIERKI